MSKISVRHCALARLDAYEVFAGDTRPTMWLAGERRVQKGQECITYRNHLYVGTVSLTTFAEVCQVRF